MHKTPIKPFVMDLETKEVTEKKMRSYILGHGTITIEPKRVRVQTNTTDSEQPVIHRMDLPDRLSLDHSSKFYTNVGHYVRVSLNGEDVPGCVEYCVSGGWVRLAEPGPDGKVTRDAVATAEKTFGLVTLDWRMSPSRQVRRALARVGS